MSEDMQTVGDLQTQLLGQMGKETGTQNRIMLYRRWFFSRTNPHNHQLVLISVYRRIDFQQKSSNRCLGAALQEAEAIIHMELTLGTYNPGGCSVPSWPTARELHPANAYCCCSSSPRCIPLGHRRAWLCCGSWNKGCPFLSHPQNCSQLGKCAEAQEESWDRQGKTFAGILRREDRACADLSVVFWGQKAKMICQLQVLPTQFPMVFHNLDAREKS